MDSETIPSDRCPLCGGAGLVPFARAHGRAYRDCPSCRLVSMDPADRPGPSEERARYEEHENDPSDPRYRRFLDRLCGPLTERLPAGAHGLDYGSGPGPTLSVMLSERGSPTENFDPFFADEPALLRSTYDFVTCTETAEHFFEPAEEFETLFRLIRPGGWLGVMTEILEEETAEAFAEWHYIRDPTHVVFYRWETFRWLEDRYRSRLERPHPNVALFQRPGT